MLTDYLAQKVGQKTSHYSESIKETTGSVKDIIRNKETLINYNVITLSIRRIKEQVFHSEHALAEKDNQLAYTNLLINVVYTIAIIIPFEIEASSLERETAEKVHDTLMNLPKTIIEVAHYIPDNVKERFDLVLKLSY